MLRKLKIKTGVKIAMAAVALLSVIGFTESSRNGELCRDIVIHIDNQYENYFINDHDILSLMTQNGSHMIKGVHFSKLNLKAIEERVEGNSFIKNVEIFKDLKGNLIVNVLLRRPLARVIRDNAPHAYVAEDGTVMPVSDKFSSRVILISGEYTGKLVKQGLLETDNGKRIYRMLKYIQNHDLWRAQIAEININKNLEMILYPQVTKQYIEFGKPEDLEEKFRKLEIFYKKILPRKGWNTYERVNLMYEGQIVAE